MKAGKAAWQAGNCNDCHTILGIGGYYAPDLTKVADIRDAAWLKTFLTDPQKAKPGTTMPNMGLTGQNAENLVAFFQWVSRIDTNNWPPKPVLVSAAPGGAAAQAGQSVAQQKGCLGCYKIGGQGAAGPGPDLSAVGSRMDRDRMQKLLANPKSINPSGTMPAVPLAEGERDSLVTYLLSLK